MVTASREKERIVVRSGCWEIVHDLTRGGCASSLTLPHGSGTNLFLEPCRCYVDGFDAVNEDSPRVSIRSRPRDVLSIRIEGNLKDADRREAGIRYRQVWLYTPWYIRIETRFSCAEPVAANVVGVCHFTVSAALGDFVAGPSPWTNPNALYSAYFGPMEEQTWKPVSFTGEPSFEEGYVPFDLALYRRGVEGFQVQPSSEWFRWNEQIVPAKGHGRYAIIGHPDRRATSLLMEPYRDPATAATLSGSYEFTYTLGIPNITERLPPRYVEVAIKSLPWPSDEDIREWAYLGVNVLRLHDEMDATCEIDHHWHDGTYPPYDKAGMKELDRVIATAHRYGMKIIPYFSIYECYPTSPAFRRVAEWKRTWRPDGHEQYTAGKLGSLFGVLLCPDSGWRSWFLRHVRLVLKRHRFDGVYFDWATNVPCYNRRHMPGDHAGLDGIHGIMESVRKLLGPNGIIISHIPGQAIDIVALNFSDEYVTLEEKQSHAVFGVEEMPSSIRFTRSSTAEIVPNIMYPKAGETDPRARLRQGIPRFVLFGTLPYSYVTSESSWGYGSFAEGRQDPQGIYALFDAFKAVDFSEYTFRDCFESPIRTTDPSMRGALYCNRKRSIIAIANSESKSIANARWTIDLSSLGWDDVEEFSLVGSRGEEWRIVTRQALAADGISLDLAEYAYRVFFLEPHTPDAPYVIHNTRAWRETNKNGTLEVATAGPEGQDAELQFWSPVGPGRITLDGNLLREGSSWHWDDRTRKGGIRYRYGVHPHVLTIGPKN